MCNFPWTFPRLSPGFSQTFPTFFPDFSPIFPRRTFLDFFHSFPDFSQTFRKLSPNFSHTFPRLFPDISPAFPVFPCSCRSFSSLSPDFLADFSQTHPRLFPDFSSEYSQTFPWFSPDFSQTFPTIFPDLCYIIPRCLQTIFRTNLLILCLYWAKGQILLRSCVWAIFTDSPQQTTVWRFWWNLGIFWDFFWPRFYAFQRTFESFSTFFGISMDFPPNDRFTVWTGVW